jgi:hypothetical protein
MSGRRLSAVHGTVYTSPLYPIRRFWGITIDFIIDKLDSAVPTDDEDASVVTPTGVLRISVFVLTIKVKVDIYDQILALSIMLQRQDGGKSRVRAKSDIGLCILHSAPAAWTIRVENQRST